MPDFCFDQQTSESIGKAITMNGLDSSENAGNDAIIQANGFDLTLSIRSASGRLSKDVRAQQAGIENGLLGGRIFTTTLARRYGARRLGSTVWKCKMCHRKATDLIHTTRTILPALGTFGSSIFDKLIPICQRETCIFQGNAVAERLLRMVFRARNQQLRTPHPVRTVASSQD